MCAFESSRIGIIRVELSSLAKPRCYFPFKSDFKDLFRTNYQRMVLEYFKKEYLLQNFKSKVVGMFIILLILK